jgi:hypothetical protein
MENSFIMEVVSISKHNFHPDRHQYFKIQVVQEIYCVSIKKTFGWYEIGRDHYYLWNSSKNNKSLYGLQPL